MGGVAARVVVIEVQLVAVKACLKSRSGGYGNKNCGGDVCDIGRRVATIGILMMAIIANI